MTEFHFAGIGTLINVAGIIVGGLLGLFGGRLLTAGIQRTLQDACALAVIFLGADGALKFEHDAFNRKFNRRRTYRRDYRH